MSNLSVSPGISAYKHIAEIQSLNYNISTVIAPYCPPHTRSPFYSEIYSPHITRALFIYKVKSCLQALLESFSSFVRPFRAGSASLSISIFHHSLPCALNVCLNGLFLSIRHTYFFPPWCLCTSCSLLRMISPVLCTTHFLFFDI